ncbi:MULTISPECIES: ABC transporter [unclassified Rhodococcus (in: high G+C Gram-positive bacteria)]|uniref:ABC transporter n=1 Tax=unclassified Rhodococcus (in: high G+C Gram-positive bacteria) TaxID=192944 RepID=UPI001639E0AE|nr:MULTISPECIES: ABC transporter [unclassified Rhodococcus (in: high G+C Gram-positive bacteria)]MBC2640103.1 ABC transporter [Rhodococcus sp. 3A]MBC2895151.1 ABC transporter [Rhodococcus sp. 4CII]
MPNTTPTRAAIAAVAVLTLGACAAPDEEAASPGGRSQPGSDLAAEAGSTEVEGPEPRLVVSDADSGRVDVLDLATAETLHSFEFDNPARITTVKDRYAFAVDGAGGAVHVVDGGSWTIDHGDHTHSYTKPPVELGAVEGGGPSHVIEGDDAVATFFDGDGAARVIDFAALRKDSIDVGTVVETDGPHHGVALPIADGVVVSRAAAYGTDSRPAGFEFNPGNGEVPRRFDTACPNTHGAAVTDTDVLAACDDGLFLATTTAGAWTSEKIPYPAGIDAATRPTSVRGQDGLPIHVAAAGPAATNDGVLIFDSRTRGWTHVRTADRVVDVALPGDGRSVFAVLADGTFRMYDTTSGAETASSRVLAAPYDATVTPPVVVVGGTRAYVSDPASKTVAEIDFRDDARVARTLDVGVAASTLGVVGL